MLAKLHVGRLFNRHADKQSTTNVCVTWSQTVIGQRESSNLSREKKIEQAAFSFNSFYPIFISLVYLGGLL